MVHIYIKQRNSTSTLSKPGSDGDLQICSSSAILKMLNDMKVCVHVWTAICLENYKQHLFVIKIQCYLYSRNSLLR